MSHAERPKTSNRLEGAPQANRLDSDRKLAELALGLIQQMGNAPAQREVLRELAEAWRRDWRLTLRPRPC